MAEGRSLHRIGDPVLASAPAGVRIRTRIHPTAAEAKALTAVGELLGSVYRCELARRVRMGRLDRQAHAAWRAQRKQALTEVSSSRWAGVCGSTGKHPLPAAKTVRAAQETLLRFNQERLRP